MSDSCASQPPVTHREGAATAVARETARETAHETARRRPQVDDEFFDHYFRRIDPDIAASFTDKQRAAMYTMFGARGVTRHAVDIRCTLPLGWRRIYLVFLLGRDRRHTLRRRRELGDLARQLAWALGLLGLLLAVAIGLRF